MDRKKFILKIVNPDGHCGYHAILNQFINLDADIKSIFKLESEPILKSSSPIKYDKKTIKQMRLSVYNGMMKNPEKYVEPTNKNGRNMPMDSIITNAYMHDSVIQWISKESNICITVYFPLGVKDHQWQEFKPTLNTDFVCEKSIYLENTNGNHFNILVPKS